MLVFKVLFWGEAILTFVRLINRIPTIYTSNLYPCENCMDVLLFINYYVCLIVLVLSFILVLRLKSCLPAQLVVLFLIRVKVKKTIFIMILSLKSLYLIMSSFLNTFPSSLFLTRLNTSLSLILYVLILSYKILHLLVSPPLMFSLFTGLKQLLMMFPRLLLQSSLLLLRQHILHQHAIQNVLVNLLSYLILFILVF